MKYLIKLTTQFEISDSKQIRSFESKFHNAGILILIKYQKEIDDVNTLNASLPDWTSEFKT